MYSGKFRICFVGSGRGRLLRQKNIPKEASYLGLINSADKQAATAEIFLQRAVRLAIANFFF
jgi:hypothetical protein